MCLNKLISLSLSLLFLDINECAMAPGVLPVLGVTNPYCSQICMNDPGTFNCSCVGGYHMDTNFNTCFADGKLTYIIGCSGSITIAQLTGTKVMSSEREVNLK